MLTITPVVQCLIKDNTKAECPKFICLLGSHWTNFALTTHFDKLETLVSATGVNERVAPNTKIIFIFMDFKGHRWNALDPALTSCRNEPHIAFVWMQDNIMAWRKYPFDPA